MGKTGVLLIHGTFGSPHEFDGLAQALVVQGYEIKAVTLPGHGDEPDQCLYDISGECMLGHCVDVYNELSALCDDIVVLGHSLGGILALLVATERFDKVRGVVALSTPFEHGYFVNYFYGFFHMPFHLAMASLKYVSHGYTPYRSPLFMPWWFPKLYREADWLFQNLQRRLPMVEVPVCLAHSPYDVIVPYAEMNKIAALVSNPKTLEMHTLTGCGHQIFPISDAAEDVTELVLDFVRRCPVIHLSYS